MRAGVVARIALALCVVLAALVGWHWYLIDRLIDAPPWGAAWAGPARATVVCLGLSIPVWMFAQRGLPPRFARLVGWPASMWMGVAWIALVATAFAELVALAVPGAVPGFDARARALAALGVTLLATSWGLFRAFRPRLNRVNVKIENWPAALEGLRIVQLSDVHIGPMLGAGFARRLTERVNALSPDLVVVTGDLVDGSVQHVGAQVEPFAELRGTLGCFFVTGNHDFYSGADPWCAKVESLGITVLRNEHIQLGRGDAVFCLAGVDDHRGDPLTGARGEDLEAALAGVPMQQPIVLLAHDPATFRRARTMGVDLQISGHTHGGQIWPFVWVVRATVKWVAGLYREDRAQIFVSRGTGFWGPPIRIGAPGELTELTILKS